MPSLNDQTIITDCLKGDKKAWAVFVQRSAPLLLWAIKQRLHRANIDFNRQDTQDILQNVFVLLWAKGKLKQVRNRESIASWLVMVAANCASNHFRKPKEIPAANSELCACLQPGECAATEGLEQQDLRTLLENALQHLNVKEQLALKLNYLYDKDHGQIAQILKVAPGSVSSILKRAKEKIRQHLQKQGWER